MKPLPPAVLVFAALLGGATPGRSTAGERYFVAVFGSQSVPKIPQKTHTWLTAVRLPDSGPVEVLTISWLPATLVVRDLRLQPEPGVNLSLDQTLAFVTGPGQGQRASVWGPFEVRAETFANVSRQHAKVAGGFYQYLAVDSFSGDPQVANCIHAVTDADPLYGRDYYPLIRFGDWASHYIVRQFVERDRIVGRDADHGWLLNVLGVTAYPVVRRDFRAEPGPRGRALDFGWRLRPAR